MFASSALGSSCCSKAALLPGRKIQLISINLFSAIHPKILKKFGN